MRGSVVAKCAKGHRRTQGRSSSRCVRWYFITEGPRTADGKRRRLWSGGFPTRKAAEVALRAELSRRDEGIVLAPERLTLAEYAERWLTHVASTREPSTVSRYRELLEAHVLPALGGRQLKALQPLEVQAIYDRLAISGRQDGTGGLHPRTVGHVHRCLHAALKQAVRWRLVVRNVCAGLEPPKVPPTPMVTLSAAQARQLLEQADGWLHTFVLLGAATGARRDDLLALRWSEVDLDAGTVRIARSLGLVAGELDIAAQLGHRDGGALALKVYMHALPEGLARAGAHLDQVLAGQQ